MLRRRAATPGAKHVWKNWEPKTRARREAAIDRNVTDIDYGGSDSSRSRSSLGGSLNVMMPDTVEEVQALILNGVCNNMCKPHVSGRQVSSRCGALSN